MQNLREVTRYTAESAQEVLEIFQRARPADSRPREAIDAAWTFARCGERGKTLRDTGWAAHKAAQGAGTRGRGQCGASSDVRSIGCILASTSRRPPGEAHSRSSCPRGESGRT